MSLIADYPKGIIPSVLQAPQLQVSGCPKRDIYTRQYLITTSVILVCLLLQLMGCTDGAPRIFGTVERDRLTLTAPVSELISQVNVVEGQQVKEGEVLVRLDSTSANARVALRQAELKQAQAILAEALNGSRSEDINKARAALRGANANVKEALQNFDRVRQLFTTRVLSQADLDAARAVRDTSLAKQAEMEQDLILSRWRQCYLFVPV